MADLGAGAGERGTLINETTGAISMMDHTPDEPWTRTRALAAAERRRRAEEIVLDALESSPGWEEALTLSNHTSTVERRAVAPLDVQALCDAHEDLRDEIRTLVDDLRFLMST